MSKPSMPFWVMSLSALMVYIPEAQAYIDPGVAYGLIQALFALLFGGAVAWVLRPWTYVKSLFRRKSNGRERSSSHSREHSNEADSR